MKSEGFLDEIEKIVDEVWDTEKKQINNHVDSYEKNIGLWEDKVLERIQGQRVQEYQREYLREIQNRTMWDTPYSSTRLHGDFPVRPISTLKHKCECSLEIEVSYLDSREEYRAIHYYGSDYAGHPVETRRPEYDHFHCPRCRQQINVIGKIMEIKVNMAE